MSTIIKVISNPNLGTNVSMAERFSMELSKLNEDKNTKNTQFLVRGQIGPSGMDYLIRHINQIGNHLGYKNTVFAPSYIDSGGHSLIESSKYYSRFQSDYNAKANVVGPMDRNPFEIAPNITYLRSFGYGSPSIYEDAKSFGFDYSSCDMRFRWFDINTCESKVKLNTLKQRIKHEYDIIFNDFAKKLKLAAKSPNKHILIDIDILPFTALLSNGIDVVEDSIAFSYYSPEFGEVIELAASENPDKQFTVICGFRGGEYSSCYQNGNLYAVCLNSKYKDIQLLDQIPFHEFEFED